MKFLDWLTRDRKELQRDKTKDQTINAPAKTKQPTVAKRSKGEETYNAIIEKTKPRLDRLFDLPLHTLVCNRETIEQINKISTDDPEYYRRSRFLGSVLTAIWEIQRKADLHFNQRDAARMQSDLMQGKISKMKMIDFTKREEVEDYLRSDNAELEKAVSDAVGGAVIMLVEDSDLDIKVAEDLDRSSSYPDRPSLPASQGADKSESFRLGLSGSRCFGKQ